MAALLTTIGSLRRGGTTAFERYAAKVEPLLAEAGARIVARGTTTAVIAGTDVPSFLAVVEFPDEAGIHAVLGSSAYKDAIADRNAAFADYRAFVSRTL